MLVYNNLSERICQRFFVFIHHSIYYFLLSPRKVTKKYTDILSRIESGATILNVACAQDTPEVVASIRQNFPDIPIIASGGKTEESILKTIEAGANSITYTPPSTQDLFKEMMLKYRET